MNTHIVCRHVKPQLCANTSQTSRPSLALPLLTNFGYRSLLHLSLNPQLQMGEQTDDQPRRLRLKARDFLPFPEGDIKTCAWAGVGGHYHCRLAITGRSTRLAAVIVKRSAAAVLCVLWINRVLIPRQRAAQHNSLFFANQTKAYRDE